MSREKQIEEMARVLCDNCAGNESPCRVAKSGKMCGVVQREAEALYNAGYRKQSEWISVDERLPTVEEEERGLVGFINGYNGKIRFIDAIIFVNYDFNEKEWWSQDYDLTDCKVEYWMPLPEAPKMKGGAE